MTFIKSCEKCAKQIEDWYHMVCGCSCHEDLKDNISKKRS